MSEFDVPQEVLKSVSPQFPLEPKVIDSIITQPLQIDFFSEVAVQLAAMSEYNVQANLTEPFKVFHLIENNKRWLKFYKLIKTNTGIVYEIVSGKVHCPPDFHQINSTHKQTIDQILATIRQIMKNI